MVRIIGFLLVLLFSASPSWAVLRGTGSSSSCPCATVAESHETGTTATVIYGDVGRGQSWPVVSGEQICAIQVSINNIAGSTAQNLLVYLDDDAGPSADTLTTGSLALGGTETGWVTIPLAANQTAGGNATWYLFVMSDNDPYASRVELNRSFNTYAGGTDYVTSTGLAGFASGSADLLFKVMKCE